MRLLNSLVDSIYMGADFRISPRNFFEGNVIILILWQFNYIPVNYIHVLSYKIYTYKQITQYTFEKIQN